MNCFLIAASTNWQIAGGIFFGIFLGALFAAAGFADGNRVKAALKFGDKQVVLTFLAMLFFGIIFIRIAVCANWIALPRSAEYPLWSSIAGGALCGIGLALSGLAPLSAIGSLATGKFGALWAISGMVLAVVGYRFWSCDFKALLEKWDIPLGAVPMGMDFFSIANPALWFAAGLAVLILIVRFAVKGK